MQGMQGSGLNVGRVYADSLSGFSEDREEPLTLTPTLPSEVQVPVVMRTPVQHVLPVRYRIDDNGGKGTGVDRWVDAALRTKKMIREIFHDELVRYTWVSWVVGDPRFTRWPETASNAGLVARNYLFSSGLVTVGFTGDVDDEGDPAVVTTLVPLALVKRPAVTPTYRITADKDRQSRLLFPGGRGGVEVIDPRRELPWAKAALWGLSQLTAAWNQWGTDIDIMLLPAPRVERLVGTTGPAGGQENPEVVELVPDEHGNLNADLGNADRDLLLNFAPVNRPCDRTVCVTNWGADVRARDMPVQPGLSPWGIARANVRAVCETFGAVHLRQVFA